MTRKTEMKKLLLALALMLVLVPGLATTRSKASVHAFMKLHPCPSGPNKGSTTRCSGHIVDHKKSLDCGGLDVPQNMQWQTIAAAAAKDKWERNGAECKHRTHGLRT